MNKTYCDKCATEITDKNKMKSARINIGSGKYILEVIPSVELDNPDDRRRDSRINIPTTHDICIHCIIDAFNILDNRK